MKYQKPSEADYGEYLKELSRIQGMPDTTRAPITRGEIPMGPDGKLNTNARVVETYESTKHRQMLLDKLNKSFEGRFGPGSIGDAQRMYRGSEWARKQRENPGPKENMPYRPSAQTMNNFANDDRMRQAEYMKSKRDAESAAARANTPDPLPDVEAPWRTAVIGPSKSTPETDFRSQAEKNESKRQLQIAKQQQERMARIGTKAIQIGDQIVNVPKAIFTDYGGSYYGGKFPNDLDHYYAVQKVLNNPGQDFARQFASTTTGAYTNPGRAPLEGEYQRMSLEGLKQSLDRYGKGVLLRYGSEEQRRGVLANDKPRGATPKPSQATTKTQPSSSGPAEETLGSMVLRNRLEARLKAEEQRKEREASTTSALTPATASPSTLTQSSVGTRATTPATASLYAGPAKPASEPSPTSIQSSSTYAGPTQSEPKRSAGGIIFRSERREGQIDPSAGAPRRVPARTGGGFPRPSTDPVVTRDSVSSRSPYLRALRAGVPFISR